MSTKPVYLSKSERLCKWTILAILLLSIALPVPIIIELNLLRTYFAFDAILFFLLIAAGIQGIVGLFAWIMLSCGKRKGRKLLIGTYISTLAAYGVYTLFLLFTLVFQGTFVIFPLEFISVPTLFAISAAVLLLQHHWTRYIF